MFKPYVGAMVTIRVDDDLARVLGEVLSLDPDVRTASVRFINPPGSPQAGIVSTRTRRWDQIRRATCS